MPPTGCTPTPGHLGGLRRDGTIRLVPARGGTATRIATRIANSGAAGNSCAIVKFSRLLVGLWTWFTGPVPKGSLAAAAHVKLMAGLNDDLGRDVRTLIDDVDRMRPGRQRV